MLDRNNALDSLLGIERAHEHFHFMISVMTKSAGFGEISLLADSRYGGSIADGRRIHEVYFAWAVSFRD